VRFVDDESEENFALRRLSGTFFGIFVRKDLGKASEFGSVCRARFEPRIFVM